MEFNFTLFFRVTYLSLFESQATNARLTWKRVGGLGAFYILFIPTQLINWICFGLDHLLFPGFRRIQVRQPVFIVGNPRSGSTHLLRVLARDEETFACAKLGEMLLAPSIIQRKLVRKVIRLDRRLGSPVRKLVLAWQERAFRRSDQYHRIRLHEPDEDEFNLVPIFSAIHLVFPFPFMDEFARYVRFDTEVGRAERKRFMAFYRRSMQRTLYMHGPTKRFLSKSPANSGRIATLQETFPDARFIYTTRRPMELVPSLMSLLTFQWQAFCDPLEEHPFRNSTLAMTKHWYDYTIRQLEQGPASSYLVVRYADLVGDLDRTITRIYAEFQFQITPQYVAALQEEVEKARRYESRHEYSLAEMGLTREQIAVEYRDVIARFGFDAA